MSTPRRPLGEQAHVAIRKAASSIKSLELASSQLGSVAVETAHKLISLKEIYDVHNGGR